MIDWIRTKELFGFSNVTDLNIKRPKVVCKCDGCGKERVITVRVKSKIVDGHLDWLCPACVSSGRSDEISKQLKNYGLTLNIDPRGLILVRTCLITIHIVRNIAMV